MVVEIPARRIDFSECGPAIESTLKERVVEIDLAGRIERALAGTGYGVLRTVRVSVRAGAVVLEGRVPTFYLKQVAQSAALAVPGVQRIRNDLEVVSPA